MTPDTLLRSPASGPGPPDLSATGAVRQSMAGSLLEPPGYQKLEGPWIDGKDPAASA